MCQINEKCGLSSGKFTAKRCSVMQRKRKNALRYRSTIKYKRRRLELQGKIIKTVKTKELREGMTYEPGCCLAADNTTDEKNITNTVVPPTIQKIPTTKNAVKVYFDIETTSLAMDCDIVQLSARYTSSIFNEYLMPSKPINKRASEVTGLALSNNKLCHKGRQVNAKAPAIVLQQFLSWLGDIGTPVIMYGHNCRAFDCPRIVKLLKTHKLISAFSDKVIGFVGLNIFYCSL